VASGRGAVTGSAGTAVDGALGAGDRDGGGVCSSMVSDCPSTDRAAQSRQISEQRVAHHLTIFD
jgi:hypothetical protein